MKKHARVALGLLLITTIVAVVASLPAGVQGGTLPNTGWWNSLYIQNVGSESATITSTAYRVFGATPYASTYRAFRPEANPIPAGESVLFRAHDFAGWAASWAPPTPSTFGNMPNDFQGGLSVLSNQPTRYLVELTNRPDSPYGISQGLAAGQYEGYTTADEHYSLYFPLVKRNAGGKSSTLFIQFLGPNNEDVYVTFYCPAQNPPPYVTQHYYSAMQVETGSVLAISPADDSVINPDIGNGKVCSAIAENNGTAKMVGLYTEYFTSQGTPSLLQTARVPSGATGIGTTLYAPYFKNKYPNPSSSTDRSTGFTVMNLSADVATVRGTFRCSSRSYTFDITDVYNGLAATFVHPAPGTIPTDCLGTAKFTAKVQPNGQWGGVSLAGMSSEAFLDPIPTAGWQQATTIPLVPYSAGSTTIYLPAYKEAYGGRTSTLYVRNVGSSTAQVSLVFRDTASSNTWTMLSPESIGIDDMRSYQLMNQKPAGYWQEGTQMPVGRLFAVTVTSTYGNVPLIAAVEEASYAHGDNSFCWGNYVCLDRVMYLGFK